MSTLRNMPSKRMAEQPTHHSKNRTSPNPDAMGIPRAGTGFTKRGKSQSALRTKMCASKVFIFFFSCMYSESPP